MTLPRILIVDDEPGMLRSVERVLGQEYKVATTRSPVEAVRLAESFKPSLAIIDIQMPEMDGFELMERLRSLDTRLDIILMTGSVYELDAKLIRAIRKEAFYFLQKPFDREVLQTLVERCLELRRLDETNRRHVARIENELAEARAFQQSLLPPLAGRAGRADVNARYIPYAELAGDFFDYVGMKSGGATLLLADVSGHGASAAMLTGIVKSAFHSAGADDYAPAAVVDRVANGIRAFTGSHFITLICVRVGQQTVEFVNAGHPPGIVAGAPDSVPTMLSATGPLISPAFKFTWTQETLKLRGGDRILLYSDGIIDVEGDGGWYGVERLVANVIERRGDGNALLDQVIRSVRQFAGGRPFHDDLTLLTADL